MGFCVSTISDHSDHYLFIELQKCEQNQSITDFNSFSVSRGRYRNLHWRLAAQLGINRDSWIDSRSSRLLHEQHSSPHERRA